MSFRLKAVFGAVAAVVAFLVAVLEIPPKLHELINWWHGPEAAKIEPDYNELSFGYESKTGRLHLPASFSVAAPPHTFLDSARAELKGPAAAQQTDALVPFSTKGNDFDWHVAN